MRLTSSRQPKL